MTVDDPRGRYRFPPAAVHRRAAAAFTVQARLESGPGETTRQPFSQVRKFTRAFLIFPCRPVHQESGLAMSRRRKHRNRHPKHSRGATRSRGRRSRSSRSESHSRGPVSTTSPMLISRSLVFVGPEEVVTTFEVEHPQTLRSGSADRPPQDAMIVKGCPRRYALENGASLQMGTLPYYRKQGDSLIWDLGEGVIASDKRTKKRRDDPADLDAHKEADAERSEIHPFERAVGLTVTTRLDVTETSEDRLAFGDNCLIWCASLKPQTAKEWSLWWDSLEPDYDHLTFLGKPAPFARALALMASTRRDLLGSYLDLQHPTTGHVEQCSNMAVFYGPVVYLDDPRDYILASGDEVERIVRSVFTKTTEHRHQREYRFAILSRQRLDHETVRLRVPPSLRQALNASSGTKARGLRLPEGGPDFCVPSPRLLQCFAGQATRDTADHQQWLSLTSKARVRLHLSGTRHTSSTSLRAAVNTVATVDNQAIEAAVRAEPPAPNDSRIAKITIDGGPGTIIHIYCLEGIRGGATYKAVPGGARVRFRVSHPSDTARFLYSTTEFDGRFTLSHPAHQLILDVVPINPAATVTIDHPHHNTDLPQHHITLSPSEDTHVTVTATSQDGTQASSFEIIIERELCPPGSSETE